jgi:hypothetical protein
VSKQTSSWLFGDYGRPTLGLNSGKIIADSVLFHRSEISEALKTSSKLISSKLSTPAVTAIQEENLQLLCNLLQMERVSTNGSIDQRGFSLENKEAFFDLQLSTLPWSRHTWDSLATLGVSESDPLVALDAFSWGEILEVSDWRSILEILHLAHDWAPFAIEENLLVPQEYDLHELADFLERSLIARTGAKAEDTFSGFGLLRERNAWGVPRKTLEEIGSDRSLTRERIRQLENRLERPTLRQQIHPFPAIQGLLQLDFDPTFIDPIQTIENFFDQTGNWDLPGIEKLIELASGSAELLRFRGILEEASLSAEGVEELSKAITRARSVLGVIRLRDLRSEAASAGIDENELRTLITRRYPRSIFSPEYVAARQLGNECMLFNYVSDQLKVTQPLHIETLHAGVVRAAKGRSAVKFVPPISELRTMLEIHQDFHVDASGQVSTEIESSFDPTITGWMVRELSSKSGSMAAKSTLLRAGALEGFKFSTLAQYLQYGPEFRLVNNAIACLVGSTVNEQDRKHALAIAEVNEVKNRVISYQIVDDSEFTVKFVFSTNFMVSGVLSVNSDVAILLGPKTRKASCCPLYTSGSNPKLSRQSLWANLSSLRDHLWVVHNYREAHIIEFRVTDELVQPVL